MKVWITKEALSWLQEMQAEGRTREIIISSFRRFNNDSEIEVELIIHSLEMTESP